MIWKWVLGIAAIPVAAAAVIYGVGLSLPKEHIARAETLLPASPGAVAAVVRDVAGQPRWRTGVSSVEVLERSPARLTYVERSEDGTIRYDFVEEVQNSRFRSTIADPDLPFGGSWTIALTPAAGGTKVSIEERGVVRDPLYRFLSALVFGHETSMMAYLSDLRRALEHPVPRDERQNGLKGSGRRERIDSKVDRADRFIGAGPSRVNGRPDRLAPAR